MTDPESTSSVIRKWPLPDEILFNKLWRGYLTEAYRLSPKWAKILILTLCVTSAFIDPLFLYIYVIDKDSKCYNTDHKLLWVYIVSRTTTDTLWYIACIIYIISNRLKVWFWWRKYIRKLRANLSQKNLLDFKKLLPVVTRRQFPLVLYALIALPIPPIWLIISNKGLFFDRLLIVTSFQYMLRVHLIYTLLKQRPHFATGIGRLFGAILDVLPFILAAHLYGAVWYYLAIKREIDCWMHAGDSRSRFHCKFKQVMMNTTLLSKSCPIDQANVTAFDFGIYLYALQSDLTRSNFAHKIFHCFWWGLRNLSSLGSNLNTSLYIPETIFSILISITGVVLFLVYLNDRLQMQASKKKLKEFKLRPKMRMINQDIKLWLFRNGLSYDWSNHIMKTVQQKLEENKDVDDVEKILFILPIRQRKRILTLSCMTSLKKVPMLENMDEQVLEKIREYLKPVSYAEDTYIFREGEPVEKMIFITRGTAWSYTTSNTNIISGASTSRSSIMIKRLEKGQFWGQELLNWEPKELLNWEPKLSSDSEFPISTKTIKSQKKLEAFVIRAEDLRIAVFKFRWRFLMHLSRLGGDSQLEQQCQHSAASFLQVKWRSFRVRRLWRH